MKDLKLTALVNNKILAYTISKPVSSITGLQNLVQRIAKRILTITGSNAFNPNLGTGFMNLVGGNMSDSEETVKNNIPVMVDSLKSQLLIEQEELLNRGQVLNEEEYLIDITLKSAEYDSIYNGFIIELLVTNKANNTVTIKLP